MDENDVVVWTMQALKRAGWMRQSFAFTNQRGDDIVATRGNITLYVEAKGTTSSKPGSHRFGKRQTESQFRVSASRALFRSAEIRTAHAGASVAIALPNHPKMSEMIESVEAVLTSASIGVLFVNDDGSVVERNRTNGPDVI